MIGNEPMKITHFSVDQKLKQYIQGYWLLEGEYSEQTVEQLLFPVGAVELIIHLKSSFLRRDSHQWEQENSTFIEGQQTGLLSVKQKGVIRTVGITELFGETIPDSINFIDNSWYSVINSDINDFKISFSNSKPSVYSLDFVANNLYWDIYLPTGKNGLKGTKEIVDLSKSIRLKGQDFSSMQYNRIAIQKGDDLNYSDYYNFLFNKNAYGKNKFSVYMSY